MLLKNTIWQCLLIKKKNAVQKHTIIISDAVWYNLYDELSERTTVYTAIDLKQGKGIPQQRKSIKQQDTVIVENERKFSSYYIIWIWKLPLNV